MTTVTELDEDGYDGPAVLRHGETDTDVEVTLRGHFDPISGRYSWYGRVLATAAVTALLDAGVRRVVLGTPHGEAQTVLSDVDPWGRPRVEGFGPPPFAVLTDVTVDGS
jgi:hypothetical protein